MERTCVCCGCTLENDYDVYYVGNEALCEDCYDTESRACDCCGERIWNDDDEGDDNIILCSHCRENHYSECHECGRLIYDEDVYYESDDSDYPYCRSCFENIKDKMIHSYSYKPEPIFYGEDSMFLGVELEIDKGGESDRNAEKIYNAANYHKEHIYIKHDGSIDDGMEIVTHPMTLYYHKNNMPWKEITEKAVELGYKSHQTSTCGLHVHVNRSYFSDIRSEQDECISRVLFIIERFWEEMLLFSRRTRRQLERWAARYGIKDSPKKVMETAASTRYSCVNLCNYYTIEFRIFKGTLRYNTLIATLEMVAVICRRAKEMTDDEITSMSWPEFVAGIEEPELIQYLKERRLYINDEVTEMEEY